MKKEEINMVYTSITALPKKNKGKEYIFLAGSIDFHDEGNWRGEVIGKARNKFHFFDPTNKNHNQLSDLQMRDHIKWELDALKISDRIILNFLPDAESPISLVELGLYVATNKLIVVCPREFYKSRYIAVLCEAYNVPLFNELNLAVKTLFK